MLVIFNTKLFSSFVKTSQVNCLFIHVYYFLIKKSNKFTITTDRTDNKKQSTTQEGTNNRDWYLAVEVKIKMYGKKTEKYRL